MARRIADNMDGATGLPLQALDSPILTLRADGEAGGFDSVGVYVGVNQSNPPQVVRLDLFAELRGIRAHVASAFVPSGFRGPVFLASGFMADTWTLYAAATARSTVVKAAMQSCECSAAGPGVDVPAALQQFPLTSSPLTEQQAAPMIAPALAPFGVN